MWGAIAGDIIGSPYEGRPIKVKEFPLFSVSSRPTDDSVLTVATMDALLYGRSYAESYKRYGQAYPHAGYGGSFRRWLFSESYEPYGSFGNGSAMRVSPVGRACDSAERVLAEARASAACTHDHPEGIKGAQATALALFRARTGASKGAIAAEIEERFGYDLSRSLAEIRPQYRFDPTCQGSVPEALIAFLEGEDWEDTVRGAVSLGGDSDTLACIAGAVAEAWFGPLPEEILAEVRTRLSQALTRCVEEFARQYPDRGGE
jgi:ADP-ribosylglycohydrolase